MFQANVQFSCVFCRYFIVTVVLHAILVALVYWVLRLMLSVRLASFQRCTLQVAILWVRILSSQDLGFLPEPLRSNHDLIIVAVQQNHKAVWSVPVGTRANLVDNAVVARAMVLAKSLPFRAWPFPVWPFPERPFPVWPTQLLPDPSPRLLNDFDFIMQVVAFRPFALMLASEDLVRDPTLVSVALENLPLSRGYIDNMWWTSMQGQIGPLETRVRGIFEKFSELDPVTFPDVAAVWDAFINGGIDGWFGLQWQYVWMVRHLTVLNPHTRNLILEFYGSDYIIETLAHEAENHRRLLEVISKRRQGSRGNATVAF